MTFSIDLHSKNIYVFVHLFVSETVSLTEPGVPGLG